MKRRVGAFFDKLKKKKRQNQRSGCVRTTTAGRFVSSLTSYSPPFSLSLSCFYSGAVKLCSGTRIIGTKRPLSPLSSASLSTKWAALRSAVDQDQLNKSARATKGRKSSPGSFISLPPPPCQTICSHRLRTWVWHDSHTWSAWLSLYEAVVGDQDDYWSWSTSGGWHTRHFQLNKKSVRNSFPSLSFSLLKMLRVSHFIKVLSLFKRPPGLTVKLVFYYTAHVNVLSLPNDLGFNSVEGI